MLDQVGALLTVPRMIRRGPLYPLIRRGRGLLFGVGLSLLLSACQTTISTTIDVASDASAVVEAMVEFSGDIAVAMEDSELRSQFENGMTERGLNVIADTSGRRYRATLRGDQVQPTGALTGVVDVSTEVLSDNVVRVVVNLSRPSQLEDALVDSVQGAEDHAALVRTAATYTTIRVIVSLPGDIAMASGGDVSGSTVVYETALSQWADTVLVVEGSLRGSRGIEAWLLAGGAVFLVAVGLFAARRRAV